jgi:ribosomal protein S18 acetylase RimI-like enzyme
VQIQFHGFAIMEIRKATHEDLEDLVRMGRAFFYEAKWDNQGIEWNDEAARLTLADMLEKEDNIIYMAHTEIAIGMIAGVIYPVWYNHNIKMAQEFFWYVIPEKRRGVGLKLLKALEEEIKARGIKTFAMLSVETMPSLDSLYIREGYAPSEKTFIKRL